MPRGATTTAPSRSAASCQARMCRCGFSPAPWKVTMSGGGASAGPRPAVRRRRLTRTRSARRAPAVSRTRRRQQLSPTASRSQAPRCPPSRARPPHAAPRWLRHPVPKVRQRRRSAVAVKRIVWREPDDFGVGIDCLRPSLGVVRTLRRSSGSPVVALPRALVSGVGLGERITDRDQHEHISDNQPAERENPNPATRTSVHANPPVVVLTTRRCCSRSPRSAPRRSPRWRGR